MMKAQALSTTIKAPERRAHQMLPPFAKEINEILAGGKQPNVYLFTGPDAWNRAEIRRRDHGAASALVLPLGADPNIYSWPAALDSIVVDARTLSRSAAIHLGAVLIGCGIRSAAITAADEEPLCFRRKVQP